MRFDDLITQVTSDLVTAIEAGADNWTMPWHTIATTAQPRSIDHRPYRGLNALVLALHGAERGWTSGTWATYLGWQRHSAQVRRGERATHVVLWKPVNRSDNTGNEPRSETTDDTPDTRGRLVSRVFAVFAAEQVDGADPDLSARTIDLDTPGRILEADDYFSTIGADVVVGGNSAHYSHGLDRIHVPHLNQFQQPALYYSTLAHEHTHWTAHPTRLARNLTGRFGDDAYAIEELIAELGAAYWSAQTSLSQATRHDHASYIAHWIRVLREQPRVLLTVTARAQAALDYLNNAAGILPPPVEVAAHEPALAA